MFQCCTEIEWGYIIVHSGKLVFTSLFTKTDWQHYSVSSPIKKTEGKEIYFIPPPFSSAEEDVNILGYELNTTLSFQEVFFAQIQYRISRWAF